MKLGKHFYYWGLPSIFLLLCIYIFFFDFLGLAYVIAPEYNREFGLIENVQLLLILGMVVLSFKTYRTSNEKFKSSFFLVVSLFALFIFLEEVDYGLNWYDYFSGKTKKEGLANAYAGDQLRNIHNQGKLLQIIKLLVYIGFAFVLIILPYLFRKIKIENKYVQWLVPSHYLAYSLIAMVVLNQVALYFSNNISYEVQALQGNVSEFEEVFIYYIAFLYLHELKEKKLR